MDNAYLALEKLDAQFEIANEWPVALDFGGDLRSRFIPLSPSDMENIVSIKTLRRVDLSQCAIDDKKLEILTTLKDLESINLSHNQITTAGIRLLSQFPKLRQLSLTGVKVDREGVRALAECTSLRDLDLLETGLLLPARRMNRGYR